MRISKIGLTLTSFALIALLIPSVFGCEGKVTGGGHGKVGDQVRTPAGSFGFNAMWTKNGLKGELQYIDHTTGDKVHAHDINYLKVNTTLEGNKPWPYQKAWFGGPCTVNGKEGYSFEVYVQDKGEPGTDDTFYIEVWKGYFDAFWFDGGSVDEPILVGNIQIHKPMP